MLSYLRVENFAVVKKAELDFSPGLNVMTGETGTGKSILIGAVSLLFRRKVPPNVQRDANLTLTVEALFSSDGSEVVLRRDITQKKTISFVNGRLVPFNQLQQQAEPLLNIYGQNEHVFLLNTANHQLFLDSFCGNEKLLAELSGIYREIRALAKEFKLLKSAREDRAERLDFLNFQIEEIDNLGLSRGDDVSLNQRQKILASVEDIISRSSELIASLYGGDDAIYNSLAGQLDHMKFLTEMYPDLSPYNDDLKRFYNQIPELSAALSKILGGMDFNEDELDDVEGKLLLLNRLISKHRVTNLDSLLDKRKQLETERNNLKTSETSLAEKEIQLRSRLDDFSRVNERLRASRRERSADLSTMVQTELEKLEMKRATFLTSIQDVQPTLDTISERGSDRVEFLFSANPDQAAGPIRDMISGGELSRLMLVLKSINRERQTDGDATFIFDEIDSGIGGKTAEFVGEKLRDIATTNQVVCISHLPQIASFAQKHFLVQKHFRDGRTYSSTTSLDGRARVAEIARLMAGSAIDDDVLRAAANLLETHQ